MGELPALDLEQGLKFIEHSLETDAIIYFEVHFDSALSVVKAMHAFSASGWGIEAFPAECKLKLRRVPPRNVNKPLD